MVVLPVSPVLSSICAPFNLLLPFAGNQAEDIELGVENGHPVATLDAGEGGTTFGSATIDIGSHNHQQDETSFRYHIQLPAPLEGVQAEHLASGQSQEAEVCWSVISSPAAAGIADEITPNEPSRTDVGRRNTY